MSYRWYGFRRFLSDILVWRDLKKRCAVAFAEGQKARRFWEHVENGPAAEKYAVANYGDYRTFTEGTEEHEAWTYGKDGAKGFYVTFSDLRAKAD